MMLFATVFLQAQGIMESRNESISLAKEHVLQANDAKIVSGLQQPIMVRKTDVKKGKSSIKLGNSDNDSNAAGTCGKGAISSNIDQLYGSLNTYDFADDLVVNSQENFYLEEMEIIFLMDYDVTADELFLDFYTDAIGGGPSEDFIVSLDGAQVDIETLGEYGTTIKDIMLITVTFATPIAFPGGMESTTYWAGTRITHSGSSTSAAAIGTNTMSASQTFYVNRTGSWEKNTAAYNGVPQQDLLLGFYGQCEEYLSVNQNNKLAEIHLYPNPLNAETFYINAPKLLGQQAELNIIDLTGRIVYQQNLDFQTQNMEVSLSNCLKSGMYLVTLKIGEEKNSYRLIKQ